LQARAWCNGIDEVIEKPFNKEQILQAVRRLIPERKLFAMER
jgi:FixJ family two-component response regulator